MALRIDVAELALRRGSNRGLEEAAEHLLGVSRDRVPLEEGQLQRSGRAQAGDGEAAVIYGGATSEDGYDYSVIQHEEPDFRHAPGRTWKFLEHPLHEEARVLKALMADGIRRRLRRGGR